MAEVLVKEGDLASGDTYAFTNIVGWAYSPEDFHQRISDYFKRFDWYLLNLENVKLIDFDLSYSSKIQQLIDQAQSNPKALLLATFHSYKPG